MDNETLNTVTLGNTKDVNHFVLGKHSPNRHLRLEQQLGKVHLVSYTATVHLHLKKVAFFWRSFTLDLRVSEHTYQIGSTS